jgi:hypothetical protein
MSATEQQSLEPDDGAAAPESSHESPGRGRGRASISALVWTLATVVTFAINLRLARTRAVNSDGASNALQAWDMLHGNPLLRGWRLSDVSFYPTELPEYLLVELVHGLNSDVVPVSAAVTYTLAILLAALLAKGRATGREAVVRVAIAAGIMLAPQLNSGTNILLSSPDHLGTSVPVMAVWLLVDRCRAGWYVPVISAALLGAAAVADSLAYFIGVLPLAAVCAVRVYRGVVVERQPRRSRRYDSALGLAGVVGAGLAFLTLRLIRAAGGFYVAHPATDFIHGAADLPNNLSLTGEGLLLLGGADFFGLTLSAGAAFVLLHLVGVLVAGWGTTVAGRRFPRERDLVVQVLFAAIVINLAAYAFSTLPRSLPSTRQIAAVLPFSAALAGRLLARRISAPSARPLLVVVLLGYLAGLGNELRHPSVSAQNQQLASWLAAHHLEAGLSGYWEANVVTLTSGDRVKIRYVVARGQIAPGKIEVKGDWYDPARSSANFVVLSPGIEGYPGFAGPGVERAMLATFGPPARTYRVGTCTVLVWDQNLLTLMR